MDWKYAHFEREATFQAPREVAEEAARAFAAESLADWQITEEADGFEARGRSSSHAAPAKFCVEAASFGTKVTITLLVQRSSAFGFMLFDIGGFYNGQLRKWMEGIEWQLYQKETGATQLQTAAGKPASSNAMRAENLLFGCAFLSIIFILGVNFVCAVIGLLTGNLFLPGSRGNYPITVHGPWARIDSAIVLAFFAWIFWGVKKGVSKSD